MARDFVPPPRDPSASNRAHCDRLAEVARDSAAITRSLARYHDRKAVGELVAVPVGGEPFEEGAGAPVASETRMLALASEAQSSTDHRIIGEYFAALADAHNANAAVYEARANAARNVPRFVGMPFFAVERRAKEAREAAAEATAIAIEHIRMADDMWR
jgi:hypothetical protein